MAGFECANGSIFFADPFWIQKIVRKCDNDFRVAVSVVKFHFAYREKVFLIFLILICVAKSGNFSFYWYNICLLKISSYYFILLISEYEKK